jgi:hypothetical protein
MSATPRATPDTSADSRWLVDPSTLDCVLDPAQLPGALAAGWHELTPEAGILPFKIADPADRKAAAKVYQLSEACWKAGRENDVMWVLYSDDLRERIVARDVLPASSVALGQEVSEALGVDDPTDLVIEGEPLPSSMGSAEGGYPIQSRGVVLPEDVVKLADGRIGTPLRILARTNDPGGVTAQLERAGHLKTTFMIFDVRDGRWVVDEILPICLGDCDGYWDSREQPATPVASPVGVIGDWRLAIMGNPV